MSKWTLVLLCDNFYLTRCLDTISSCRQIGSWEDDIVMLVDPTVNLEDPFLKSQAKLLQIQIRQLPPLDTSISEVIHSAWSSKKSQPHYHEVTSKLVQYLKFYLFDPWFKQWDAVFYIDAGMRIYGDLNRMKAACIPEPGFLYVHSNGYPNYDTPGTLRRQFDMSLDESITEQLESHYDLNLDSFQSTTIIFNTASIEDSTISDLFALTRAFPVANRNDQGILNLYFYGRWKQLPLRDAEGWLYDFLERNGHQKVEYLMLKYPLNQLFNR